MTGEIENLILEHLKIIQSELVSMRRRIDEVYERVTNVERLVDRLERIERRLELTD